MPSRIDFHHSRQKKIEMGKDPLEQHLRKQIDANLKRVYDEVLSEELPDDLVKLLNRLRDQAQDRRK